LRAFVRGVSALATIRYKIRALQGSVEEERNTATSNPWIYR
jgi:hypothetical protein